MTKLDCVLGSLILGEGPVWNPERSELSVVDILGKAIYRIHRSESGWTVTSTIHTDGDVGAALPVGGDRFLSCESGGIFEVSEGYRSLVTALPVTTPDFRCNDAKLSPDGQLYVGIMDYEASEGAASLWRITRTESPHMLLDGLTIPNGMDWWEDEFWFVNGPTPEVRCYRLEDKRLVDTGRAVPVDGVPDGVSIDAQGRLWVAVWGEGRVDCFERTGEKVTSVSVPAPQSTSIAWCGPTLGTLAVTSASYGYTDQERAENPEAGAVFFCDLDYSGRLSPTRFA